MSEKPITRYVCHSSHVLTEGEAALRKDIVVSLDDHEAALAAEQVHRMAAERTIVSRDARITELEREAVNRADQLHQARSDSHKLSALRAAIEAKAREWDKPLVPGSRITDERTRYLAGVREGIRRERVRCAAELRALLEEGK